MSENEYVLESIFNSLNGLKNKINRKINQSPRRIKDFYSNVYAGILTGGVIGGFLATIQSNSEIKFILPNFLQILIFVFMFVILYLYGIKSLKKLTTNFSEIRMYKANVRSGFFAALFVSVPLIFQNVWIRIILIAPLTIVFIIIIWAISGRRC